MAISSTFSCSMYFSDNVRHFFTFAMHISLSDELTPLWKANIFSTFLAIRYTPTMFFFNLLSYLSGIDLFRLFGDFFWEANILQIGAMNNLLHDLQIIRCLRVSGCHSKAPKIILVTWHPSLPSWIKVNTDGDVNGCLAPGGCNGVFGIFRSFVNDCIAKL